MFRWRIALTVLGGVLASAEVCGCSWDNLVWPKSKKSDTPLFRFVVNGKAGYIDRQGRIVIQPQFHVFGNDGNDDFFDGLANVRPQSYVNPSGREVMKGIGSFSEGLVARRDAANRYGYADRAGKMVIPFQFDSAEPFSEGFAAVRLGGRSGFIDKSGKLAIPPRFASVNRFSDGHALVIENGPCQLIGYGPCEYPVNPAVIVPYDASYGGFRSAAWSGDPRPRCRYSVIDRSGKVLFAGRFIDAKNFAEGLAPMGDGKAWGYVDYSGNVRYTATV